MSTLKATNLQNPSAANPAIVLAADGSATAQVSSINGGPLAGFRNLIINGNFDFWQRGTSHSTTGYGSADRWVSAISGSTATMSRQAFTLGQTAVPGEPTYFCRMAVTSVAGAANYAIMQQRIEDVRTYAGQQVTVSFWAKADAAKPISIGIDQYFGTGGSPSAQVSAIGVTKVTLSTGWQKVTVSTTLPSISGKTLGSNGDHFLGLNIWFDAGSNNNAITNSLGQQSGTFDIAQVQVEPGSVATPFERRPYGQELALCLRYFEVMPMQLVPSSAGFGLFSNWKVTKRATPTLTLTISTGSGATVTATSNSNYNLTGVLQNAFNSALATGAVTGDSEL